MEKKKAIKIATATAIVASAFTATTVAPAQSEAATSLSSQIKTAQASMKKPYTQYTKSKKLVSASVIKKQIADAKAAQTKVNTAIKKSKLSTKAKNAYYKQVKSYSVYITRAQGYLTAISLNTRSAQTALEAAIESGNAADVEAAQATLTTKLAAFQKAVAKVYATSVRKVLTSTYATPAKKAIEAAQADNNYAETLSAVTAKVDAYVALANGDLKTQALVDAANAAKAAVDLTKLNAADQAALKTKVDAADVKVAAAVEALKVPTVASVSAINATTVQVTLGGNFKDKTITAADFKATVEGASVLISKVEAGSTAGTYNVTLGATLKDGQSVTVTGAEDLTGSATAKYAIPQVTTVEAVAATVDSTKGEQKLGFKVNGTTTTVEALVADGYDVQFQANAGVFGSLATTSGNGILDKGDLATLVSTPKDSFKYKVVVTKKGAIVAESTQVEVKVYDGSKTALSDIKSFKLYQTAGNGAEQVTSNTLVSGETLELKEVLATELLDNRKDIDLTQLVKVETSNPFVVSVTQPVGATPAQLTAAGTGTATITLKSGAISKTFTVTVVAASEVRKVASVSASESAVKIARNGSKDITLTFKDQYGDVIAGATNLTNFTVLTPVNNPAGDPITGTITVSGATDAKGKTTVTVPAQGTNYGTGTLRITKGTASAADILTIPVTVEADAIASVYKLETANADSADKTLDLNDELITKQKGDHKILFNLNQYTTGGSLIAPVAQANLDVDKTDVDTTGQFSVVVVDSKGNETSTGGAGTTAGVKINADNTIEIDPNAVAGGLAARDYSNLGTYTAKVYDKNNTLVATTTFTVKDSAPVISTANFVTNFDINASPVSVASLLPDANIKITGAGGDGKVRVDANGLIFIDTNNNAGSDLTADTFEAGTDIYLGQLVAAKKSGTIVTNPPTFGTNQIAVGTGNDGVISVGVQKRGENTVTLTGDFKVKN